MHKNNLGLLKVTSDQPGSPSRLEHLNASAATIADGHLLTLHNDRHLTSPIRQLQHLLELVGLLLDIMIGVTRQSLPGSVGVRTTGFSVNRDVLGHWFLHEENESNPV